MVLTEYQKKLIEWVTLSEAINEQYVDSVLRQEGARTVYSLMRKGFVTRSQQTGRLVLTDKALDYRNKLNNK